MMLELSSFMRIGVLSAVMAMCGCLAGAEPSEVDDDELSDQTDAEIIGGTLATAFPEAVIVNMEADNGGFFGCSGAMIAPKVVLTAGHCVDGFKRFQVKAPFAAGQIRLTTKGAVFDYENDSTSVPPDQHDVGLIFLDQAINLPKFPTLSGSKVPNGTKVVRVGRIDDGQLSNEELFRSKAIAVKSAKSFGYPFDYMSTDVIEHGDSGGPDFVAGTHKIVAVNSGSNGTTEVLARVDLLQNFITKKVNEHGGFKNGGGFTD